MVREYLEKTRDELLERQYVLVERERELQNLLKENIKFIQMLEESSDPNFAAFTPRQVNGHNDKKIQELKDDQQQLSSKLQEVRGQLDDVKMRVLEINSVIKVLVEKVEKSNFTSSDMKTDTGLSRLSILEVQEKERQRIARDLHDTTVQNLTSLVHKSELCSKLIDVDPVRCKLELSSTNKILRDLIEDTRNIIYDLRPMSFDDIGFDVTVDRFIDRLKSNVVGVKFNYQVVGEPYDFDSVIEITLLRIIQEACNNAVHHANASDIRVRLEYKEDGLELCVTDNGCGFDVEMLPTETREDNSGFGMSMMKERVYLLSGSIDIKSKVGEGSSIIVKIPVSKKEEA